MVTAVDQITLGAVASFVYELLKKAKWFPLITEESAKAVKVAFAAIVAWASVAGIHYSWDPSTHVFLISGLAGRTILNSLWTWLTQFVAQEGWFQLAIKPGATPAAPAAGGKP